MGKDKILRGVLFGESGSIPTEPLNHRSLTFTMPGLNGELSRSYTWGRDDGFILVLIRMIEKLESNVEELKRKVSDLEFTNKMRQMDRSCGSTTGLAHVVLNDVPYYSNGSTISISKPKKKSKK